MNGKNNRNHDVDLADLVDDDDERPGRGLELEMAPLNGDANNGGKPQAGNARTGRASAARSVMDRAGMLRPGGPSPDCGCSTLVSLLFAYVEYACEYSPRACWTLGVALLLVSSYLLILGVVANPTEHFGVVGHDYSNIKSQYDFQVKDIDHWCLKGDDSCQCEDPLQPSPRNELRMWTKAHAGNVETVNRMVDEGKAAPDIAFLGGTVVEKMDGKWFGEKGDPRLEKVAAIFDSHFDGWGDDVTDEDALTAVSLGIVGDMNPAVLWRILNGEMPTAFNPKIWWLELGLNDLGRAECSEEVVVMGVLRVVEEILNKKPDAKIVINSLFPMAQLRGFGPPTQEDFENSWGPRSKLPLPKGGRSRMNNQNLPQGFAPPNPAAARAGSPNNAVQPKGGGTGSPPYDGNMIKRPGDKPNGNRLGVRGRILRRRRDPNGGGFRGRDGGNKRGQVRLNPNKMSQRKYNLITHRQNKIPLWTSIVAINQELQRFCDNHERVYFHDVTNIFTEQQGKFYTLNTDLITLKGIPTEAGFDAWETSIEVRAKLLVREEI